MEAFFWFGILLCALPALYVAAKSLAELRARRRALGPQHGQPPGRFRLRLRRLRH